MNVKPTLNVSVMITFIMDFDIMRIIPTAMDACRNNISKENVYKERFINVYLA